MQAIGLLRADEWKFYQLGDNLRDENFPSINIHFIYCIFFVILKV